MRTQSVPTTLCGRRWFIAALALTACRAAVVDKSESGGGASPNTAPTAPTVSVSPNPATTLDDLTVVFIGEASDADGDELSYRYVWFRDGELRADVVGDAVPAALTTKGEVWTVNVVATDGTADGGVGVAAASITNSPPVVAISLAEAAPSSADLVAEATVTDADGDPVTMTYSWAANGAITTWADVTVPASETTRGDVWTLAATPNDGEAAGETVEATVLIQNSPPEVDTLSLDPSEVYTDSVLTTTATAVDADGDPTRLTYAWTVNGALLSVTDPALRGTEHFDKGDVVQVTVTAHDEVEAGPGRTSAAVVVANSPPSPPLVRVLPVSPTADEALSCTVVSPGADLDGDPVQYTFSWQVDGVPYTGTVEHSYPGDGVASGVTLAGEEWTCMVDTSDGAASAELAQDSVYIGGSCGDGAVTLTASGVDFVSICAGSFDMGCTPGVAPCESDESPVREVTLTRDYYMSRTEITQDQFALLMGYDPSVDTTCGGDCPVERLTWHDAATFANAMSAADGLAACYSCSWTGSYQSCTAVGDPYDCEGYRLPTEAEWEGAARCGEDLPYPGHFDVNEVAWHYSNTYRKHPVAEKIPNLCGLYDMAGNVLEWTHDRYGPYPSLAELDPVGSRVGTQGVTRGGAFQSYSPSCRLAFRYERYWSEVSESIGFRVARTMP
jgi:formylglycine-generating enzyme required for sulfatase activity